MALPTAINPAMITLARESRGWTQTQLAFVLGVSQSTVAKWELGSSTLGPEEAMDLAQALEYEREFFSEVQPLHALGASLLYRQKTRVPIRLQKRVEAEINIRKMQIDRLMKSVSIEDHMFPSIPSAEVGNVEAIAREVRRYWKVPDGPIPNLTKLVEAMGGIVIHTNFGTKLIDGANLWVPGMPPMFFMNGDVSGERYRFSLAHEVGHAIMHRAAAGEEIELEAHRFASELLMPRTQVRGDLRSFNLEVARRLKPFWGASMQALIERAFHLNIISDSQRRRLYTQISAQGGRIEEPWPLPMEKPERFQQIVEFHKNDLKFTEADLRGVMFTEALGETDPTTIKLHKKLRLVGDYGLFTSPIDSSPPSLQFPGASQG